MNTQDQIQIIERYTGALMDALPKLELWELAPITVSAAGEPRTRYEELEAQNVARGGMARGKISDTKGYRMAPFYLHMVLPTVEGGREPVLCWLAPRDPGKSTACDFIYRSLWCLCDDRGDALLGALRTRLGSTGFILPGTGQTVIPNGPLREAAELVSTLLGLRDAETHMHRSGDLYVKFALARGSVCLWQDRDSGNICARWYGNSGNKGPLHIAVPRDAAYVAYFALRGAVEAP